MYRYRGYRRGFFIYGEWGLLILALFLLPIYCFVLKSKLLGKPDYLGGSNEIGFFFKVNLISLIVGIASLVLCCVLFYVFCVGKQSDLFTFGVFIAGVAVNMVVVICFAISAANIHSDVKGPTTARPASYVLCERGDDYFICFEDQQDVFLMPISELNYEALKKGHEAEKNTGIYNVVSGNLYSEITEYDSPIKIEYYFYSAMIEKAELLL